MVAKTCSYLLSPSPEDPQRVDAAIATLFEGFERMRPGPPQELFGPLIRQHGRQGPNAVATPEGEDATSPLVADLSTPGLMREGWLLKERGQHPMAQRFFLAGDCPCLRPMHATFLEAAPKVGSMFATETSETATVFTPATWSIGRLVLEVLLHRSISGWGSPDAFVTGTTSPETWDNPPRMPLETQVETAETGTLPKPLEAMESRYQEALRRSAASLGGEVGDFRCLRVVIPWPVVRSVTALRWLLAPSTPA